MATRNKSQTFVILKGKRDLKNDKCALVLLCHDFL